MAVNELITPNQVDNEAPPVAPMGADGSGPAPARPNGIAHGILSGALAAASTLAGPEIDENGNTRPRHGLGPILGGILSNAVSGLAAGADRSHGEAGGGLAAFGRGFSAVQAQRQQAIQQAKQNQFKAQQLAQEQERTNIAQQTADREQEQFEATKAHWTLEQMHQAREDARLDLEQVDRNNQTNRVLYDTVIKENGKLADIPHNGEPGNEAALMAQFSDGKMHRGPDGSLRIPIKEVNTTGLTKDDKGNWVDDAGKPVNIADRTTWSVYDLPNSTKDKVPIKGSDLQKIVPPSLGVALDPNKIYDSYSMADLAGLASKTTQEANEKQRLNLEQQRINLEAEKKQKGEPLGDTNLRGQDYLKSLPAEESALVQSIISGRVVPDNISRLLSGKNSNLLSEVTLADPDIDIAKLQQYPKVYHEFTSTKLNVAGGQLQAAGTALKHLSHLADLNTSGSMIPGSPAKTSYDQQLATVVDELGRAYSASTIPGLAKIESGLASHTTWNREAAIKEAAHDLNDKLDSLKTVWTNAAPSPAYEAKMPWIDREAQAARARLDDRYSHEVQQGNAPAGADNEVYVGTKLVGHTVGGKFVPLGQPGQ